MPAGKGNSGSGAVRDRLVVVYERVSGGKQDIARQAVQREHARAAYPRHEIEVIQDDGVSAYKVPVFERPGGHRLCELVEAGRVEAVFTDTQNRLSRGRDVEWVTFRALCDDNGTAIVINGQEVPRDDMGKLLTYIEALNARRESRDKAHMVRGGLRASAKAYGVQPCGQPPLGYRVVGQKKERRWVIDEPEAEIVRRIDAMYLAGDGTNTIAATLNSEGIRTRRGARFSARVIVDIVRNPAYVGLVRLKDDVFPGKHKPIRSDETWQQMQGLAAAKRELAGKGRGRRPKGPHLLTKGLGRCGYCGGAMSPRTNPNGWEYYKCVRRHTYGDCPMPTVSRRRTDERLLERLEGDHLDVAATIAAVRQEASRKLDEMGAHADAADRQAVQAEAGRQRAERDYLNGDLPAKEYKRLCARADEDRAGALAEADQWRAQAAEVAGELQRLDADQIVGDRLHAIREAVAGRLDGADGLDALRALLHATFDEVLFFEDEGEPGGGVYLIPSLREEAIAAWTTDPTEASPNSDWYFDGAEHGVAAVPRKAALHLTKQTTGKAVSLPGTHDPRARRA
jgi:DNA invertase Pin-like site-specific DNA recombinase